MAKVEPSRREHFRFSRTPRAFASCYALELAPEERAEVAARLLESLEPEEGTVEEIEQAWLEEIERRLDDGGPGVAWSDVRRGSSNV